MKRVNFFAIIISLIFVVSLGFAFFSWKSEDGTVHAISFDFTFDDFTFMGFTLGEGDRMTAIMTRYGIEMSDGTDDTKDYYVQESFRHGTKMVMCPAEDSDGKKHWLSSYVVCTHPDDGRIQMYIDKIHTQYESYYKGPIHIGDSFDQVYEYLSITDIKRTGTIEEKRNRKYYTCESNLGVFTFKEEPYTGLDDFSKYKDPKKYLKEGNTIRYCFKFDEYYLSVEVDETLTVSNIAVEYDPNHVLDDAELAF